MKTEILTRCGYRCDLCLAYKENIEQEDEREFLSDTWHKIYGFRISPKEIYCEGCISSNGTDLKLIDNECPVRHCVLEKGLENCSQCEEYPCDIFDKRKVVCEDLTKDVKVSRKEYSNCIKPYENKKRLDEIRIKNYPLSRLTNPQLIPNDDDILLFIGDKNVSHKFSDLISFMDTFYNLDKRIIFGGKKYGWAIQYKKSKKTIVTIFPERKNFTVLLVFGRNELEKINTNKEIFAPIIFEKIKSAKQYHDGKWIWLRIGTENYMADIKELITIKRKPDNVIS